LLLAICCSSSGTTITFDFNSGIDLASFSVFNVGELFTISTEGQDLRISKPADDGTVLPEGWLSAGIVSRFTIDGDFMVTVDFTLHDFPPTPSNSRVNESLLAVMSDEGLFEILRLSLGNLNLIEVFAAPGGVLGIQDSTLTSGRYRITRIGSTLTALFSEPGSESFTTLASMDGLSGPFRIQPFAAQGTNGGGSPRSTTALDISFDNLVIEADEINMPCLAGDLDGDGTVGIGDFLLVLAQWGPCPPKCLGDVDGDGIVGINDLLLVLANWGPCP